MPHLTHPAHDQQPDVSFSAGTSRPDMDAMEYYCSQCSNMLPYIQVTSTAKTLSCVWHWLYSAESPYSSAARACA
jgi:hypothetical protein